MAEYIDRDELLRKHTRSQLHDNSHNTVEELKVLLDLIQNAPIIDVEPVIHAHWIKPSMDNGKGTVSICSNCKKVAFSHYYCCPYCRAKMDKNKE